MKDTYSKIQTEKNIELMIWILLNTDVIPIYTNLVRALALQMLILFLNSVQSGALWLLEHVHSK